MNTTAHEFQPEEVMALLDGELSAARAAVVAEHVKTCADCAALAADFREVSRGLNAWGTEPSPARIEDRINSAVGEHLAGGQSLTNRATPAKRWLGVRVWVWQLGSGFVLAFFVGVLWLGRYGRYEMSLDKARIVGMRMETAKDAREKENGQANSAEAKKMEGETFAEQFWSRRSPTEPLIARTAALKLVIEKLDAARAEMERILKSHSGYAGQLSASTESDSARTLNATLRIPANQLDATLAELKKLGRVAEESQKGDEVTEQYVDLTARLNNSRATEKRLIEVLQTRTGKVHDVLEVEQEIARVREEIERMDAERKSMENRVQFATLTLTLTEEYNAQLNLAPLSTGGRLRNAVVEGYRDMTETALGIVLFFLQYGPSLLLWAAILFWPARLLWRRLRPQLRPSLEG